MCTAQCTAAQRYSQALPQYKSAATGSDTHAMRWKGQSAWNTLLHQTWKWVLSHGEEQHSASMPQTAKQLKPSACAVLWAAPCLPICLNRIYLSTPTGALELEQREKAAFGMNPSLSEFGWDERKRDSRRGEWREDEGQDKVLKLLVVREGMWPAWDDTFPALLFTEVKLSL